jgi:hypothetical protein
LWQNCTVRMNGVNGTSTLYVHSICQMVNGVNGQEPWGESKRERCQRIGRQFKVNL